MATPTTQKASDRPILFRLSNAIDSSQNSSITLNIRPEDLRRNEPGLQTPTLTLGGAWVDDWGPSLQTIVIAGHTGWRGGLNEDGGEIFQSLRSMVWVNWHAQRAAAVQQGQSPDKVSLIFIDSLDQITAVVAPSAFSLARSRSRPLLYQYSISLTVLNDNLDTPQYDSLFLNPDGSSGNPDAVGQGQASLLNSVSTLLSCFTACQLYLPSSDGSIANLMSSGAGILTAVSSLIATAGATAAVGSAALAATVCLASRNLIYSYVGSTGLGGLQALPFLQAASAFENALCVLQNVLSVAGALSYTDYSILDGASNCSTTLGVGSLSPFLGLNPFLTVAPAQTFALSVTALGQSAISTAQAIDPVLAPTDGPTTVTLAQAINDGVTT